MADISKIKLDDVTYNIKDTKARSDIAKLITINTNFAQKILSNTPQSVVFAGDSFTYGLDPTTHAQSNNPFPALVESFIKSWYNNFNLINCYNYGVGGAQSSAAITNFNTYLSLNPSTIFWSYGTNDITNNVSIAEIITNLDTFKNKCVENNIELIVIIPPKNYYTTARQNGMALLHKAMLRYCTARNIPYVDMCKYVDNLYATLSYTIHELQPDETHFSDYACFRDAIVSTLLPVAFVQGDDRFSYINVGRDRTYLKTNITSSNVATDIDPLADGLVINTASGNEFVINILTKKNSVLSFVGYSRQNAGIGTFTLDGTNYIMDESTGTNSTITQNNLTKEFPVILKAGLHTISLNSISFTGEQNRYYIYGFTLEESDQSATPKGYRQIEAEHQLWTGSTSGSTNLSLSHDVKQFNKLVVTIGDSGSLQTFTLMTFHPWDNYSANLTYKLPTTYNGTAGIATLSIDVTNNQFTYSTTQTAPIRSIYGYNDNSVFEQPLAGAAH